MPARPAERSAQAPVAAAGSRRNGGAGAPGADGRTRERRQRSRREGPSKNRLTAIARAERAVEAAESAMRALEDELSDPAAWATPYESAKSQARHTAARRAVEAAFAELEALSQ
jgi:ATP-binding cassette subfamily F protein 3